MAVTTRPDMAFTVSRWIRFLINPGPLHHKATNKVINYLTSIKNLTLYFRGFNNLEMVNDCHGASCMQANDAEGRKEQLIEEGREREKGRSN